MTFDWWRMWLQSGEYFDFSLFLVNLCHSPRTKGKKVHRRLLLMYTMRFDQTLHITHEPCVLFRAYCANGP